MTLAKKKRRKSNLIRSKFPKIRTQRSSCGIVYQVDARRQGTSAKGNRFTFRTKAEAQKKASEIEKEYALKGMEGMSLDFDLRSMALKGRRILEPYGKTIDDAVLFYADHLKREFARSTSAFVSDLADKWYSFKSKGNGNRILREASIKNILDTSKELKKDFGSKRLLDITQQTMQQYLDSKSVGQQRKKNIRDLFFRFFKWCVEQGYATQNPLQNIKIVVSEKEDIPIMTVAEAERLMRVCEETVPETTIYYAICLFAGLRPYECKRLLWENILEDEGVIRVLRSTSKTGWRTVKIEPTLQAWLSSFNGKKKGHVITQKGYRWYTEKAREKAGYKIHGKNPRGKEWEEDLARHTFASYWLPIHKVRPVLAEEMGNSKKMIDKHYRQYVPVAEAKLFWGILPKKMKEEETKAHQEFMEKVEFK